MTKSLLKSWWQHCSYNHHYHHPNIWIILHFDIVLIFIFLNVYHRCDTASGQSSRIWFRYPFYWYQNWCWLDVLWGITSLISNHDQPVNFYHHHQLVFIYEVNRKSILALYSNHWSDIVLPEKWEILPFSYIWFLELRLVQTLSISMVLIHHY